MRKSIILLVACLTASIIQAQSGFSQKLSGIEWVKIESKADVILKAEVK